MSNETPPKRDSLVGNPQVLAAVIGGLVTIVVAIIGIVPALVNSRPTATPPPTIVVVTATPDPTHTVEIVSTQVVTPTSSTATATTIAAPASDITTTTVPLPTVASELMLADGNILLLYDEVSFTLRNQSQQTRSLEGITFSSASGQWEARAWGLSVYNNIPAGKCLRLRDATVGQRQPPASCRDQIFGLQEVGQSALFWVGVDSFDVLRSGQVLATCRIADGSCLITI